MELAGLRILLVEDDGILVMLAKGMLKAIGCDVVGVAGRVKDALEKVDTVQFDVAMLDVNLAGILSYPVAGALRAHGKPFMFMTSYGTASLPSDMHDVMLLSKPYVESQLRAALIGLISGDAAPVREGAALSGA